MTSLVLALGRTRTGPGTLMKDDRTVRSDGYWDEDLERSGGQARPFVVSGVSDHLWKAIDLAVTAGAAREAARAAPEHAMTWTAFADAHSRRSREALADLLATQRGE